MPYTRGFDPALLADHFTRHGPGVGASTKEEYEALADEFMGASLDSTTQQCIRSYSGDILRFRSATQEFGILTKYGVIRTYYKPNPRRLPFPTNYVYFQQECKKP